MAEQDDSKVRKGTQLPEPDEGAVVLNFPNFLTLLRIGLIPVFLLIFADPTPSRSLWAAFVFILASTTDLLDGYMARKMEQVTRLGKLMDPIADKLLIISAVVLLVASQRVPALLAILLIGREMAITGLRAIGSRQGIQIPVERLGKYKTFLQVIGVTLLILDVSFLNLHHEGRLLLWASVILGLVSGTQYFLRFTRSNQR